MKKFAIGILILFVFIGVAFVQEEKALLDKGGAEKVSVIKDEQGFWQLLVGTSPFIVKGIDYSPDTIGIWREKTNEWMKDDFNCNGRVDGPYDSWIDKNGDNYQDLDEETVGDFKLLKDMGCNTIRIYHPNDIDKNLLRNLYEVYGIRVIMGNFMGAYAVASGANWETGTDYTSYSQRRMMKEDIKQMVLEYKDEPFVLLWMFGNENDSEGSYDNSTFNNTNAAKEPEAYAQFVNEICRMIKKIDPNHPVGVCNGTYKLFPYYARLAPEIDIIGMNVYNGPYGFGTLWKRIRLLFDRAVLITEYGTDCYDQSKGQIDENLQVQYHRRAWNDIIDNSFYGDMAGNALGGVIFCWLDKWWLCGSNKVHDAELGAWPGLSNDGWHNDEWMGICGQGRGIRSPFLRELRKAYYVYKDELWNKPLEK